MNTLKLTASVFLLLASWLLAANSEESGFGLNQLRNSSQVSLYRADQHGVPKYVEGNLKRDIADGQEFQAVVDFFKQQRGAYRMADPAAELNLQRIDIDPSGNKHLRLEQVYQGLKVIGGELVAHITTSGQLKTINGTYHSAIDISVVPTLPMADAIEIAASDLQSFFGKGNPGESELVVFPWEGKIYLCWRLWLYSDTPMGRWEYFIDAYSDEIIFKANRIMNENDIGTGVGVMGDPRNHIDTRLNGSVYEMKDYTRRATNNPHGHNGQMPASNYIQTNIAGGSLPGSIATDADNYWDSPMAPAVDGQVYTALVYDWLLSHFGRNGFNNAGGSMLTSVNYYAEGDNNAYWNGNQIVIWSWSTGWRSLAGCPDVIAHEWGHAVTDYTSNLVYQKESGALNESFSDMLGAAFEFAHDSMDVPDWDMGENGRTSGVGFRSMSDPHTFSDPDYYGTTDPFWVDVNNCSPSWSNDYCGVHTNSGVGNKWFYLLSDGGIHHGVTVTGIGVDNAILIAYQANAYYWNSGTDYHEAALGTISAANDLDPTGNWATQVANAWNAVGVSTPGPSLVFSYPQGIPDMIPPYAQDTFQVQVTGSMGGVPLPNSGILYYSVNGGGYTSTSMNEILSGLYEAVLTGDSCFSQIYFYVSVQEASSGIKYDPDPSSPHSAIVATNTTVIFADDFETDQGWSVSGNATDGQWDRGVPIGGGDRGDPATDYDGSGACYLTDNVDGNSDVDGGTTTLISPTFDLSAGNARINYARWYSNIVGADPNNDEMYVYISNDNGGSWTLVETVGPVQDASGGWNEVTFWASEYVTPTNQMRLRFDASDLGAGSVVEAAIDAVGVISYECNSTLLQITTTVLPDWIVGVPYNEQLTATNVQGTAVWSDLNNDLAGTGLSISTDGIISGTPTAAGLISFTARVTDDIPSSDQQPLTIQINQAPAIMNIGFPDWTQNYPYSQQLNAFGGTGALTFSDKNNDLAGSGLSISPSGTISGTPVITGDLNFTALVTDAVGGTGETAFTITVNPAIQIDAITLEWTVNNFYQYQLTATGGTGALNWLDKNNNLASIGLSLSASGLVSGIPLNAGSLNFTAQATDQVGAIGERALTAQINPPVQIDVIQLEWTVNEPYQHQLTGSGGTGTLSWVDKNGDLSPIGLSLSPAGMISGTPNFVGQFDFVAQITDQLGAAGEDTLTIDINVAVAIAADTLPWALESDPYSTQLNATGGTGVIDWIDKNSDLAGTGLSLSGSGLLSGNPVVSGTINFTAEATDSAGSSDQRPFNLFIEATWICGDANGDEIVNITDAVFLVEYIFNGGAAPNPLEAADVDCDSFVNITDAVYLVAYIFTDGPAPCASCAAAATDASTNKTTQQ